ncbi:CPK12, partial [Symbiodinium necroappetens]
NSDGTLTRNSIPADCIISAVDTSKTDLPLYVAETEATITGEPLRSFRAKHDYEEAKPSAAPVMADVAMDEDPATCKGEPSSAVDVAVTQMPVTSSLITANFRHLNQGTKKRGQMSAEATVIRDAEDIVTRAMQLQYASVSCRWSEDVQFQWRMPMLHYIACACLPDPERTEEQRHLRAGSHYAATQSGVPAGKLVFYAHCEVEPCGHCVSSTMLEAFSLLRVRCRATDEEIVEVAARNKGTPKGSPDTVAPLYRGYPQAVRPWDEWNRSGGQTHGRYSQAEWDQWLEAADGGGYTPLLVACAKENRWPVAELLLNSSAELGVATHGQKLSPLFLVS